MPLDRRSSDHRDRYAPTGTATAIMLFRPRRRRRPAHPFIAALRDSLQRLASTYGRSTSLTWSRSDERPTERQFWKIAFGGSSRLPGSPRAHQTRCLSAASRWEGESPPTLRLKETRWPAYSRSAIRFTHQESRSSCAPAHLGAIRVPVLIVQGERDAFGTPAELRPAIGAMKARVTLEVVRRRRPFARHSRPVRRSALRMARDS